MARLLREHGPALALYNLGRNPLGFEGLREVVRTKVARTRGITTSTDSILITSGSLQGMDLVNQLLLQPGDTVILEEFTYSAAISKLKKLGVHFLGAALDDGGIRMERARFMCAKSKRKGVTPKYIYTIPTVQNPTGSIMSLERRRQLLAVAAEFGVPIFEDECYADLVWRPDAPPALYALDPTRVIHIGSFSKSLAPALRVGYVLADCAVLTRMLACKTDGGTAALDQMVIAEYCRLHFDTHIERMSACWGTSSHADRSAPGRVRHRHRVPPSGGRPLSLAETSGRCRRQENMRRLAASHGVVYNAGPDVACDPDGARSYMRLCFGALTGRYPRRCRPARAGLLRDHRDADARSQQCALTAGGTRSQDTR